MERQLRNFAARILTIHALVFLLLLVFVSLALREIYRSAREESLQQAQARQLLLANQTARGIEAFYQSIWSSS